MFANSWIWLKNYAYYPKVFTMNSSSSDIVHYRLGKAPANIVMGGVLFQLVGIAFLLTDSWFSLLFFCIGFLIFSIRDYLAVDYRNNRLMKYMKILNYHVGKWESIERAKYIALVKVRTHRRKNFLTIGTETSSVDVKANLVFERHRYITLFKLKKNHAMPIVEEMASTLNIEIHDLTMRKKYRLTPRNIQTDEMLH